MTDNTSVQPIIFMTEDDEEMRHLLSFYLEREGFNIIFATDGMEAQTMIEMMTPPDLVLLDIMLPYMNGFELIKFIRQRPDWKDVPIVMLTARSDEDDVIRALKLGANEYIVKPFKPREMVMRIRRFLNLVG